MWTNPEKLAIFSENMKKAKEESWIFTQWVLIQFQSSMPFCAPAKHWTEKNLWSSNDNRSSGVGNVNKKISKIQFKTRRHLTHLKFHLLVMFSFCHV